MNLRGQARINSTNALHRLRSGYDRNALIVATEADQMPIARNNHIHLPGQRTGEHMIIVGIVLNHARHCQWRNHVGQTPQFRNDALRRRVCGTQALSEFVA